MSYDIDLCDPVTKKVLLFDKPHHRKGGTYCVGGTREATLNVTYNYAEHFYRVMGDNGIREIYGKTGAESVPILETAIAQLGDDVDDDYWAATEGNAKAALRDLVFLARAFPDGVWNGD